MTASPEPRVLICMQAKLLSPFYHNTETDSHTLKGVVRRFGFSLSWLPGMHEWRAWRDALLLFLSPREPLTKMRCQ